ncbi:MAG: ABC transporter ATP-binding protein, partial [Candidatus Schekmanbacteria bacterium]
YSSGMYVRLAFAVAAHLEPEILIVDEVLAVGDAQFQKKCLGKMEAVGKEGRTVLFVSHNMGTVGQLCDKGVLLSGGEVSTTGKMSEVIQSYMTSGDVDSAEKVWNPPHMPGDNELKLKRVSVFQSSKVSSTIKITEPFVIEVETYAAKNIREVMIGLIIKDNFGVDLIHSSSAFGIKDHGRKIGSQTVRCVIPAGLLNSGRYSISVGADTPNTKQYFLEYNVLTFSIEATSSEMNRYQSTDWRGILSPLIAKWEIVGEK